MKFLLLIFLSLSFLTTSCISLETKINDDEFTLVKSKIKLGYKFSELAKTYDGVLGVFAKNLTTGEVVEFFADSLFPTASVIKLPILVTLLDKAKKKEVDLNQFITIKNDSKVGGAGVLQYFDGDIKIKVIDAATLMIILSDNTATNAIIDLFADSHDDKLNAVNSLMNALGFPNTKLLNKVFSYATKKNTPEAIRFGLGYSSPREMGILLERIHRGEIIDSTYSQKIIDIMKNQQDESMIRKYLPYDQLRENESIIVANKTGAVNRSRIDVGLIYSPNGTFVFSIFADQSNDTRWTYDNKAQVAVAKSARILYDYFVSR